MSQLKKAGQSQSRQNEEPTDQTSHGNNSVSITPKDVGPGDAAARDLHERHLDSSDPEEKQQEQLDDAIELSFPASDPPSVGGGITRIDKPATRPSR